MPELRLGSQKLVRLATEVNATSLNYYQELRDQFRTQPLMGARQIPPNRRSVTGLLPSRKNGGMVPFESALERDFAMLLEFDPEVVAYEAQPVKLEYAGPDGRARVGYPDFLVKYEAQSGVWMELCDIKYRAELFEKWPQLKPRFKAARRIAALSGQRYRIRTEVEIRVPRLENAKFLLPYMRCEPDPNHARVLTHALSSIRVSSPRELLKACSDDEMQQAIVIPTLWCLVGRRLIETDLDAPLSMQSSIRAIDP